MIETKKNYCQNSKICLISNSDVKAYEEFNLSVVLLKVMIRQGLVNLQINYFDMDIQGSK